MLKDRRALLERELKIAQDQAAHMYLNIVTNNTDTRAKTYETLQVNESYEKMRNRINVLQFDLDLVNRLISQGHP